MASRPRGVVPVAAGLVPALLFGSIMVGARLPSGGRHQHATLGALDMSRGPAGGFGSLRDSFLAGIFGPRAGTTDGIANAVTRSVRRPDPLREAEPVVVSHAPTNDDFARAYVVPSVPFTARTDTTTATREPGEPAGCAPVGETVWYRFRAASDVGLIADTFGTGRPVTIGVFAGDSVDRLTQVGCATHAAGNAHVAFPAAAGTIYSVQIAPVAAGPLVFDLRLQGVTQRIRESDDASSLGTTAIGTAPSPNGEWLMVGSIAEDNPSRQCIAFTWGMPLLPAFACRPAVYVVERKTGRKTMVSVNSNGEAANDLIAAQSMSEDGRFVGLSGFATNMVPGDTNTCHAYRVPGHCPDVFVHDRDADGNGIFDETRPGARTTIRVSVTTDGTQADDWSAVSLLSRDGRYVTFMSQASNLVPNDTNGVGDIFVRDRDTDEDGIFDEPGAVRTTRVSVSSSGEEARDTPPDPQGATQRIPTERGASILGASSNGHYVLFRSAAPNLVPGDTNGFADVFLRDVRAGTTTRVNVGPGGIQANGWTRMPNGFQWKVSDDGRFAVFGSDATNLVPGDTNNAEDLFVRDLVAGTTERVTLAADGSQAIGEGPAIGQDAIFGGILAVASIGVWNVYTLSEMNHTMTPDGRYVFFSSGARNLVPEDANDQRDIFVRDRVRGTTTLVSVSSAGRQGNASSNLPIPTIDGRLLTFTSASTTLEDEAASVIPRFGAGAFVRTLPWAVSR
ncbi:MAG TPA: hypothetical protein VM841_04155 [Actinomycetota bacterium]|nr:hypothetical protein [Actinomycetota bacterium]